MQLNSTDIIEAITHIEQRQLAAFPRLGHKVPCVFDDVVIGPGADGLDEAFGGAD